MFPPTKNAFLKEKVEEDMQLPDDLNVIVIENHYPVNVVNELSDASTVDHRTAKNQKKTNQNSKIQEVGIP